MMVMEKGVATGGSHGVQLMVGQRTAELPAGGGESVVKQVIGIVHLVYFEDRFQTSFVKTGVVGHEWDVCRLWECGGYPLLYLLPNHREDWGLVSVSCRDAMYTLAEIAEIFGFGMDEAVVGIDNSSLAHNGDTYRADAAGLLVGNLKVYGNEVSKQ